MVEPFRLTPLIKKQEVNHVIVCFVCRRGTDRWSSSCSQHNLSAEIKAATVLCPSEDRSLSCYAPLHCRPKS